MNCPERTAATSSQMALRILFILDLHNHARDEILSLVSVDADFKGGQIALSLFAGHAQVSK